jgi:hypothetical protein
MKLGQNDIRHLSLWTGTSEKQSLELQDELSRFYSPYLSFVDVKLGKIVATI